MAQWHLKNVEMLPSEKFKKVIKVTRVCCKTCGADVADPNYKVNLITYFVGFCIVVYFVFTTVTVYLNINEGWGILLESFCMVGSVLQGITKLLSGIFISKMLCARLEYFTLMYIEHEVKGIGYTDALNKCISRIQMALKIAAFLYTFVIIWLVTTPLIVTASTNRRITPMQFYIPVLDINTTFGYIATAGIQSISLILGAFGNFAGDMYMLVYFAHFALFADLFSLRIIELNELATTYKNPGVTEKLMDALKWHQSYTSFAVETDMCFYWINFMQITTSGLSLVLTLFILFTGDWTGTHPYLCLSFSMLYLYCGMGTIAEVANDDFIDEIYNIHWYNMTIDQQYIVKFMLMKSQSPKKITVGGVLPLSVSTGLQVTKTVYSVFMMLVNSFN